MFSSLKDMDLRIFSPAKNSLPRHIPIDSLAVRLFKQVGVSLWFHCHARRIIAEHQLERVNLHTGPGGVLCVRRLPVPVIVTCHHTYLQQVGHLRSQFWKVVFLPFERRTYRLASRIVAVSEATKQALVERYGISQEKIIVIHNAVDPAKFHPLGTRKGSGTLLYVGRIDQRKGVDFLISSMSLVRERLPDARLLVAGRGSSLQRMRMQVKRLGLEGCVEFLGFVPDDRLNELYNRADCAVVPSVFEGFGITVIEALAAGTRVIGTDVDGIREILQSGDYGPLVAYGDRRALADAIVSELSAPRAAAALRPQYLTEQFALRYRAVLQAPATEL
jgi:glycosyltransferase involved in cell wall biosynthesis